MLSTLLSATALAYNGELAYDYHLNAAAVRQYILSTKNYGGDAQQLRMVPPASSIRAAEEWAGFDGAASGAYSLAGTTVSVGLRIFKIVSVRPASGELRLKVWYRLAWQDDRLSWDPAAFGNVTSVNVRAADPGPGADTEIWVPDVIPYNVGEGIGSTLEPASAIVDHTGSVFWSRPGVLDLLCAFSGLVNFPYDTLNCPVDIGGWLIPPAQQGVALLNGDAIEMPNREVPNTPAERSAMPTYSEWQLRNASATLHYYEYTSYPGVPWPVISALITLKRHSTLFYTYVLLLPPIFLAALAISTFFMSHNVGRLGFGITILLAAQFGKGVVASVTPTCNELLWIDIYLFFHEVFTFCGARTASAMRASYDAPHPHASHPCSAPTHAQSSCSRVSPSSSGGTSTTRSCRRGATTLSPRCARRRRRPTRRCSTPSARATSASLPTPRCTGRCSSPCRAAAAKPRPARPAARTSAARR